MACCVLCRIATTPRIEGQLAHCYCICEKGSASRNATRWKWERFKGAGLDWAVCHTSTCWRAWGRHTGENVSVTSKEYSKYAPRGSTANHIQSAPTRTANMTGKAGSKDTGLKTGGKRTRAQRKMEERGPPRRCEKCVRKTRWSRQLPHDMF